MRIQLLAFALLVFGNVWAGEVKLTDPMTLTPTDDTFLSPEHVGKAQRGPKPEFQVYTGPDKQQYRALLKFDLSEIKAPPTQAILRIFCFNVGNPKKAQIMRCHPMMRDWTETDASWDMCLADDQWVNLGGDFDPIPACGCTVGTRVTSERGLALDFDITALVQQWVLKRRPNFGVALFFDPVSDPSGEIQCRFRSKEADKNQPELRLGWNAKLERGPGMVPGSNMRPYGDPVRLEPVWTSLSLPIAHAGKEYSEKLTAKGGVRPYKFTSGILPAGLTLSDDGALSGTPAKEGKFPIQFTCASADGKKSSKTIELVVQAPSAVAPPVKEKENAKAKADKKSPDEE